MLCFLLKHGLSLMVTSVASMTILTMVYQGPMEEVVALLYMLKKCHSHSVVSDVTVTNPNVECLTISLQNIIVVAIGTDPLRLTNHNFLSSWKAFSLFLTLLNYLSF